MPARTGAQLRERTKIVSRNWAPPCVLKTTKASAAMAMAIPPHRVSRAGLCVAVEVDGGGGQVHDLPKGRRPAGDRASSSTAILPTEVLRYVVVSFLNCARGYTGSCTTLALCLCGTHVR